MEGRYDEGILTSAQGIAGATGSKPSWSPPGFYRERVCARVGITASSIAFAAQGFLGERRGVRTYKRGKLVLQS